METQAEYLKLNTAMVYVSYKTHKSFKKFCKEMNIPIIRGRVSKTLIDKKLSGKR